MAKKKKETVVCWECKKSFKGADACKDHANAKRPRHQWQEPTASALRESLVQGPSAGPSRAVAIGTNLGPSIASATSPAVQSVPIQMPESSAQDAAQSLTCHECGQLCADPLYLICHRQWFHKKPAALEYCAPCRSLVPAGLESHYMESSMHPKCPSCEMAFEGPDQLQTHLAREMTCLECCLHHTTAEELAAHCREAVGLHRFYSNRESKVDGTGVQGSSWMIVSFSNPSTAKNSGNADYCNTVQQAAFPGASGTLWMETSALKPATEEHLDGSTLTSQSEQKESTNGDTNTAKEVGDAEAETYMLPIPTQAGIIGLASLMGNEDGGHTPDEDADSGCSVLSYGSFVDVSPDLGDAKSASSTCSPVSNRDGQAKQPQMSSSTCPEANTADGPAGEGFAIGTDSHCRLEGIQQPQGMFALTVPGVEEIPRLPAPHLPCSPSSESFQIVTMPKPPAPEPQSPHETAKGLFGPGSPRSLRGDPGVEMDKLAVYTDSRAPSRTTSVNAPQNVSWHCRSCQKTPCNAPTATICGHIFCQSCIVHELSTTGCCPVCNKVFLLGLDVYI